MGHDQPFFQGHGDSRYPHKHTQTQQVFGELSARRALRSFGCLLLGGRGPEGELPESAGRSAAQRGRSGRGVRFLRRPSGGRVGRLGAKKRGSAQVARASDF